LLNNIRINQSADVGVFLGAPAVFFCIPVFLFQYHLLSIPFIYLHSTCDQAVSVQPLLSENSTLQHLLYFLTLLLIQVMV